MSYGYGKMGDGLAGAAKLVFAILLVSVPLGLWKLWDLLLWLFSHVQITFK